MNILINVFFPLVDLGANQYFLCNKFWEILPPQYFAKHGIQIMTYFRKFQRPCARRCSWILSETLGLLRMLTSSVYFILTGQSTVSGNTSFPQT